MSFFLSVSPSVFEYCWKNFKTFQPNKIISNNRFISKDMYTKQSPWFSLKTQNIEKCSFYSLSINGIIFKHKKPCKSVSWQILEPTIQHLIVSLIHGVLPFNSCTIKNFIYLSQLAYPMGSLHTQLASG